MLLPDGFSSLITINYPTSPITLFLREKELQPFSLDLGGPIDTSTMQNQMMRTQAAKSLVTTGEVTLSCQYDPGIYLQLLTRVIERGGNNNPQNNIPLGFRPRLGATALMSWYFPDGSRIDFYAWVEKMTPPVHKEGDMPLMEVKICLSNRNITTSVAPEYVPVFTPGVFPGELVR